MERLGLGLTPRTPTERPLATTERPLTTIERSSYKRTDAFYAKEKEDFQDYNNRLERYIHLVKGLERDNSQLVNELRLLADTWNRDTNGYQISFTEAIKTQRDKSVAEVKSSVEQSIRAKRIRHDIEDYNRRIDEIRHAEEGDRARCAELQSDISSAERELETQLRDNKRLDDERNQLRNQNATLYEDYKRIWDEIDRIRLELAEYQAREQRLLAEKEFLLKVQEREAAEIGSLIPESSFDAREYFKNDIALAIKDIKVEYEESHRVIRSEVTSYYYQKLDELRKLAEGLPSDEPRLRQELISKMENMIGDLRMQFGTLENKNRMLEDQLRQIQNTLRDDIDRYEDDMRRRHNQYKEALESYQRLLLEQGAEGDELALLELEIYRRILECEEKRWGAHIATMHESYSQITKHRTYITDVYIKDCDEHGDYVIVENLGYTSQNLGGYRLSRRVGGRERSFTFPDPFILGPRQTVQVSARGYTSQRRECNHYLTFDSDITWGTNEDFVTRLYDKEGVEVSTIEERERS
ncbi:unnamed protein product [Cylicocyclus nassatus]|uniref:LTD domain-containing protein n=1 Tax=Cylicocyclus nassatus TaxID=53992 RepID=A0AA36GH50_CYLNA|nr:unnamed protein product [Cylicocyclus nassatus]